MQINKSEVVTAALGNTHWRDNLRYLKGLDGAVVLSDGLDLGANELTINSLETVGVDGIVNKEQMEDHTHQDAANCGTLDHGLALTGLSDNDHTQYVLHTEVDDAPVDGVTTDPISSNWAFDHDAATTGTHGAAANTIAHTGTKLDDFAATDDVTDLNTSITAHGLCPKLDNDITHFLNGQGGFTDPGGAVLTVSETQVFSDTSVAAWTDLDLSGTIGVNAALVLLKIDTTGANDVAVRKNGDTDEFYSATGTARAYGCATGTADGSVHIVLLCATDASGVIEWKVAGTVATTVDIIAYIK